jgi:hypothetical protein
MLTPKIQVLSIERITYSNLKGKGRNKTMQHGATFFTTKGKFPSKTPWKNFNIFVFIYKKWHGMARSIFLPISFVFLSASQRCLPTPLAWASSCGILLQTEYRTVANSRALSTQRFSTKVFKNWRSSLRFSHSYKNQYIPTFSLGVINYWKFLFFRRGGGITVSAQLLYWRK